MKICFNGSFEEKADDSNDADYGDGCFETMRLMNGTLPLWPLHYARLCASLRSLEMDEDALPNADFLLRQIIRLAATNGLSETARVKLSVFRGNTTKPQYCIQTMVAEPLSFLRNSAAVLYPNQKKQANGLSFIKSHSRLLYIAAGLYAHQHNAEHAFILNTENRIAESHLSNLFILKDGLIKTPPLSEGAVAGVMRHYLLHNKMFQLPVAETAITVEDIKEADEIFLTNAFRFVMPVHYFEGVSYSSGYVETLYRNVQRLLAKRDA